MNLAVMLVVGSFLAVSPPATVAGSAALQASTPPTTQNNADHTSATQDQQTAARPQATEASKPQSSTSAPGSKSSGQKPSATKRVHKKRASVPNCVPASTSATSAADPSQTAAKGTSPTTAAPPANCPPAKVVVQQGGSSEPTIELAGGAGGVQASQERVTANQMLDSTEENLKKIGALQLTSDQQDMVSQIRQYIEQSKSAEKTGDVERARTLAWKAQQLSEELLKPQK